MVLLFYTNYISLDFAHKGVFHANLGKGGILKDTNTSGYYHKF